MPIDQRPIAVFDSGLGGLTVVRELRRRLPHRSLVYFGDTARVPYGTKTTETVVRFTQEIVHFLMRLDPCCLVAACNTASAVALPRIEERINVPVVGVVSPGANEAASAASDGDVVAVIATTATINSNAYRNALHGINPNLAVVQKACPLFVPLVEEGRSPADPLVRMAVREYLEPIRRLEPSAVVLGCTHYPMLVPAIREFLGERTVLVDSAVSTARFVEELLQSPRSLSRDGEIGKLLCYVSDNPQQFQSIGSRMLGEAITDIARICPEEFAATSVFSARRGVAV